MVKSEAFEKDLLMRSNAELISIRSISVEYFDIAKTVP